MKNALNENIRELRIQNGLNQVEFARRMNVTKQCVSNWENDNVQPSIEMLVRMADFFKVSTDRLLGRSEERLISAEGLDEDQIAHLRLLIQDFCALNSQIQK